MVVQKKPKYRVFGEELSTEVAFLQAASILDHAAFVAIEERALERLETLAVLWMELGERLMGETDEEEDVAGQVSVGFTGKGEYERVE